MKLYKYYTLNADDGAFAFGSYLLSEVKYQRSLEGGKIEQIWTPSAPDAATYDAAELRLIESKAQVMEL